MTTYTATLTLADGTSALNLPEMPCNPRYVVHTLDSFVLLDSPTALKDVQDSGTVIAVYRRIGSAIHIPSDLSLGSDPDATTAHCLYAHVPDATT